MQKNTPLPEPNQLAQVQSDQLSALIRQTCPMPFSDYMQQALYAPGLGYYSGGAEKFGPGGDFITAPDISPLFAQAVAAQIAEILTKLPQGDILEFGAGSGRMAVEILLELETLSALPRHYYMLELSADLRQRQQVLCQQRIPHLVNKLSWLDQLPAAFQGVMLANEVLDAMPVSLFKATAAGLMEYWVVSGSAEFGLEARPASSPLSEAVTALSISFEENYCSEINMQLKPWLASLSDSLTEGAVLLIDYGFPQHEYYLPERDTGTLMCHYRHRAHTDPLILTGLQDITAHVDFTAVAKCATAAGFTVAGYTTQMHFLTNCGLLNMAEEAMKKTHTASEQYAISQAIKKLLLPSEMGELFKAMLLVKQKPNVSVEYSPVLASPHMLVQNEKQCLYKNPLGFSQYDLTHKL